MHSQVMHNGISMDFADILLIINVFAIAVLLGILYVDEIITAFRRVSKAMNPHTLLSRVRFWFSAYRTPD
jgi:hypothetical protein